MAVSSSSSQASKIKVSAQKESGRKDSKKRKLVGDDGEKSAKRTKCPGVRLVGGRIYDSENGKTCHQCRQKTLDLVASCKNQLGHKHCTLHLCHKCLLNRYGEKAEEVALLDDWKCPRCRGICNCSFCMKKRGHQPTGLLVHTAKATGFSSVSDMLQVNGNDSRAYENKDEIPIVSPKKAASRDKEPVVISPRKQGKENQLEVKSETDLKTGDSTTVTDDKQFKEKKSKGLKELNGRNRDDIPDFKKSGPREPTISGEIPKKQAKRKGKDAAANLENEDSKMGISKDVTACSMGTKKVKEQKKRGQKNEIAAKALKNKDNSFSKDVTSSPMKTNEGKRQKNTNRRNVDAVNKEDTSISKDDSSSHKIIENAADLPTDARVLDAGKNNNAKFKRKMVQDSVDDKNCAMNIQNKEYDAHVPLPQGTSLTHVAGIELPTEDAGHALQFFEFCEAFGQVLNVSKGHAEVVLRDLMGPGERRKRTRDSMTVSVRFHTKLLSLLLKDMGEKSQVLDSSRKSWLKAFGEYFAESPCVLNDLPSNMFEIDDDGYDKLDFSKKIRLLNFLCDETLRTEKLRSWIDAQNSKSVKREKKAKEKVTAMKDKMKQVKKKFQDELARAIIAKQGAPLSISEHEAIVSQIKNEVAQARADILEAMGAAPKNSPRSDAFRTEPILLDDDGHAFWKLKGFKEGNTVLQDIGNWEAVGQTEKWYFYEAEQKDEVERYINSIRTKKLGFKKTIATIQSVQGIHSAEELRE